MNMPNTFDKFFLYVGKLFLFILAGILAITICFVTFMYAATWLWPESYGSYALGNNIYMLDWDGDGRIIVRGTNVEGNVCYGGELLIPTYGNEYDSVGNLREYVIDAKSDDNWIIAKTGNRITNQKKYYIINKNNLENMAIEDIIVTRIESFTDSMKFSNRCIYNGVNIDW